MYACGCGRMKQRERFLQVTTQISIHSRMEIANKKQQGGFMKSKLIMSFYRAAKPSSSSSGIGQFAETKVVEYPQPSCAVHLAKPGGGFEAWDGYVHGPHGGGGDEQVDMKATSYIQLVKERRRLEELNIIKEGLGD